MASGIWEDLLRLTDCEIALTCTCTNTISKRLEYIKKHQICGLSMHIMLSALQASIKVLDEAQQARCNYLIMCADNRCKASCGRHRTSWQGIWFTPAVMFWENQTVTGCIMHNQNDYAYSWQLALDVHWCWEVAAQTFDFWAPGCTACSLVCVSKWVWCAVTWKPLLPHLV